RQRLAVLGVGHFLVDGPAEPVDDGAEDLPLGDHGIHDPPRVVDRDVLQDANGAGLALHLHRGDLGDEGERDGSTDPVPGVRRLEVGGGEGGRHARKRVLDSGVEERRAIPVGVAGDVLEGDRAVRGAPDRYLAVLELEVPRVGLQ
ncbi:MAG: hypothetical protein FD129_2144, partial [bacterium]